MTDNIMLWIALAFLIVILAVCAIIGLAYVYKQFIHGRAIYGYYGFKKYSANRYNLADSQYWGKYCPNMTHQYLNSYPTINDVGIKSIADQLSEQMKDLSEYQRASALLAVVQQTVRYTTDTENRGEYWQLPWQTAERARGDCEDGAFLYTSLASMMGLDVITVWVDGHMASAVHIDGMERGFGWSIGGKKYLLAETISAVPILGFGTATFKKFVAYAYPTIPTSDFTSILCDIN